MRRSTVIFKCITHLPLNLAICRSISMSCCTGAMAVAAWRRLSIGLRPWSAMLLHLLHASAFAKAKLMQQSQHIAQGLHTMLCGPSHLKRASALQQLRCQGADEATVYIHDALYDSDGVEDMHRCQTFCQQALPVHNRTMIFLGAANHITGTSKTHRRGNCIPPCVQSGSACEHPSP